MRAREVQLTRAFVRLADSLVDDYDLVELLHGLVADCVDLLGVEAAGLLLSDQRGSLHVMATSSEQSRLLELFQLHADQGPCMEAFSTGRPVLVPALAEHAQRWEIFAGEAARQGFTGVYALPMRLRSQTIGALNLFCASSMVLDDEAVSVGQALADVATIGILQQRAVTRGDVLSRQLQIALDSRVAIEQAKGVLAERARLDVDEAFCRLRRYARNKNLPLLDVAKAVIDGSLDTSELLVVQK